MCLAVLTLVAAALNGACVVGGNRQGQYYAGPSAPNWPRVDLANNTWIEMPYAPQREGTAGRLDDGSRIDTTSYRTMFGDTGCLVFVSRVEGGIGADPFDVLDDMARNMLGGIEDADVVSADAVWLMGHPGSRFELQTANGRRAVIQQYSGRSRSYSFVFIRGATNNPTIAAMEQRFFGSIRLDTADAPSPFGDGALDFARFGWIYPPEIGLAIELPGVPRRVDGEYRSGDESYETATFEVRSSDGRTVMGIRVIDFGSDGVPEGRLAAIRAFDSTGVGTISGVRAAQRQGYGGEAYVIEAPDARVFCLQLVVGDRVVRISHRVPRGEEETQAEHRRRFFNSIRIL